MRLSPAGRGAVYACAIGASSIAAAAVALPLPPPRPVELGRLPDEPAKAAAEPAQDGGTAAAAPADPPWPSVGSWRFRPLQGSPELEPSGEPAPASAAPPAISPPMTVVHIPLPPRRPTALGSVAPLAPDPEAFPEAAGCLAQLREAGAAFAPAGQPGNGACAIDTPVRLSAVKERSAPGGTVSLPDHPVVSCRLALRFGDWVRAAAPVLAASRNAPLVSITTGPGWECRGRNRRAGGKLSAHANGLALDINTFIFANKMKLPVSGNGRDEAFSAIRRGACAWFTTVLGPGSDGYHEDHLHLDILRHGRDGKYRLCR